MVQGDLDFFLIPIEAHQCIGLITIVVFIFLKVFFDQNERAHCLKYEEEYYYILYRKLYLNKEILLNF